MALAFIMFIRGKLMERSKALESFPLWDVAISCFLFH